jgi:hypothetical protein
MIQGILRNDELTDKIYTIAYGDDANKNVLSTLANRANIKNVYCLISSEL